MDRAVIIGTYESLGFHFCTSLLEEGYEVIGINYKYKDEELLEEKRMEIGRNANFQEAFLKEWLPSAEIQDQTLIIIDCNYFYLRDSAYSLELSDFLEKFLVRNEEKIKETRSKVICLLPIENHDYTNERLNSVIRNVKASDYQYLYFSREVDAQNGKLLELIEGGF